MSQAKKLDALYRLDKSRTKNVRDGLWLQADIQAELTNFNDASRLYGLFAQRYDDQKRSKDALRLSGYYADIDGDAKKAVGLYTQFVEQNGSAATMETKRQVEEVAWRRCMLLEDQKNWERATACFKEYISLHSSSSINLFRSLEAGVRLGNMYSKLGRAPDAKRAYRSSITRYKQLSARKKSEAGAKQAAAHAAYQLLEIDFRTFKKTKISLSKKSLKRKLSRAYDLACVDQKKCRTKGKYFDVIAYGDATYGICSLFRVGQVYENLANSIREAPSPRLSPQQLEIYQAELEAVASQHEETAKVTYQAAAQKSAELKVYHDCVLGVHRQLSQLEGSVSTSALAKSEGLQQIERWSTASYRR